MGITLIQFFFLLFFFSMLCLFLSLSCSWWAHAHMAITEIALEHLSSKQISKLMKLINRDGLPIQSIVDASAWQDDLKDTYNFHPMGDWHFSDIPIVKTVKKTPVIPNPSYNVTSYLNDVYVTLKDKTTTSLWAWSFALRSILHFVGDVHTPHHNCALYNDDMPTGDHGGNLYHLNCEFGAACNSMHFFWDAIALDYMLARPSSSRFIDQFKKNISKVESQLPEKSLGLDMAFAPNAWSQESFEYAKKYGYDSPMNDSPNESYYEIVRKRGNERVVAAGHRLGYLLIDLLNDAPDIPESFMQEIIVWSVNGFLVVFIIFCIFRTKKISKLNSMESLTQNTSYV